MATRFKQTCLIKSEVADDVKNRRALGDIGERKPKPNGQNCLLFIFMCVLFINIVVYESKTNRDDMFFFGGFEDGCICEESPELIRTERERGNQIPHCAYGQTFHPPTPVVIFDR
ncbi:unnamed protein product [Brassica rapa]|uniref:Uncharacterized protein n=1 Tax=Brassica campestris TaxID=3711 RepID=A0A8D9FVN6_BRACM|nr:unnamed protein product [Brassica rapa]